MGLFGKKKEEDFEDEDELVEEESLRTRRIKDLKSENKKKRKEPPKPWGKRERYTILIVFLSTILVAGFLALSARDFKLPGFPRFSFNVSKPNWDLDIFNQDPIVIGKNYQDQKVKVEKATIEFEKITTDLSGTYTLYVVDLSNNYSFGVSENKVMEAASLIKLPTMAALYREVEAGNVDLETKYTLKNSDKRGGSGSLSGKPAGTVLTYRDLVRLMGKESDNTAFNIIRVMLGDSKIDEVAKEIGMIQTSISDNSTTSRDIGMFFQKLWNDEIVNSSELKEELMGFLTDTIYEDWLAKGIPDNIPVIHKYGRELHVINDAGIVASNSPYVVVIMSKGIVESEGDEAFPELSKAIYTVMVE